MQAASAACSTPPTSRCCGRPPAFCVQAGEVVEFLVEEGEPVEYKQPVLVIAPYFGG